MYKQGGESTAPTWLLPVDIGQETKDAEER